MSSDEGDSGEKKNSPNHFDALFAAAEASIDRLKAEKHRDEFSDDDLEADDHEFPEEDAPLLEAREEQPDPGPPPPPGGRPSAGRVSRPKTRCIGRTRVASLLPIRR